MADCMRTGPWPQNRAAYSTGIRFAASFRKQSRHRQSLPSDGIGSRAASSAHQHGPDRLQVNSVPQPEQARRREGGLAERFVMNRASFRR
jgi:hypothetical protein